jgi:hypothetical protein
MIGARRTMAGLALVTVTGALAAPQTLEPPPPPSSNTGSTGSTAGSGARPKAEPVYEATVRGSQTWIYSGPGLEFYPVRRLEPGDRVVVFRRRSSGWTAILPPRGCFSWIRAEAVDEGKDAALVRSEEARVYVGRDGADARHVFQVTLRKGDRVDILDKLMLVEDDGSKVWWYKVVPHSDELRYVRSEQLQFPDNGPLPAPISRGPADQPLSAVTSTDPPTRDRLGSERDSSGGVPVGSARRAPRDAPLGLEPLEPPPDDRLIPAARSQRSRSTPRGQSAEPAGERPAEFVDDPSRPVAERITSLRGQFDRMRSSDPEFWSLDRVEKSLADLRAKANETQKRELDALADSLDRLRLLRDHLARTGAERRQFRERDAELLERQRALLRREAGSSRRYDAEGTLRRSTLAIGDRPVYDLLNRDGVRTHLVQFPESIDTARYVGRKVGLLGVQRTDPSLNSPILSVEQIMPIEELRP